MTRHDRTERNDGSWPIELLKMMVPLEVYAMAPVAVAASTLGIMSVGILSEVCTLVAGNTRHVGRSLMIVAGFVCLAAASFLVPLLYDWYFRRLPREATPLGLSVATARTLCWLVFAIAAAITGIGMFDAL